MVVAVVNLLQHAHHAVAVLRVHLDVRNQRGEHGVQLRRGLLFQFVAVGQVGHAVAHDVALGDGGDVQPRAANQEGNLAAGEDAVDGLVGQALEVVHGEEVVGFAHVDQVVGNALHLLGRDLAAAQVVALKHLAGVGGDDLAAVLARQLHAKAALAGGVGARDNDQLRFLFHESVSPSDVQSFGKNSSIIAEPEGNIKMDWGWMWEDRAASLTALEGTV